MRTNIPELLFETRATFREWLQKNAKTSEGVWLIFGKTKTVLTLSANAALEEALCFGWIDGQIQSIDNTKYLKYFAKRRVKSVWSEKNKKAVVALRNKGAMTELGEKAIESAKQNGSWDAPKSNQVTREQVEIFVGKLCGISLAYENFNNMSPSVRQVYTRRYFSFKTEKARQADFEKIVDRLKNNLRPM